MSLPRKLIIGIGSPHGDDQAGWLAVDALQEEPRLADVRVRKAKAPVQVIDWLDDVDQLIFCDACQGLGRVGQVHRWNWPSDELLELSWSGTHDLCLPAVLRLAQQLGRLPDSVVIWTIETSRSRPLESMSPIVADAVTKLAECIKQEIPDRPKNAMWK